MNDIKKLKLFKELQTHALSTACACKVCRELRNSYIKEIESKIPEEEK